MSPIQSVSRRGTHSALSLMEAQSMPQKSRTETSLLKDSFLQHYSVKSV